MNAARCTACGANWSAGQFTPGCGQCGGGALDRSCLLCGGRCGRRWLRAVSDSQDANLAHWAGRCGLQKREVPDKLPESL